MGLPSKYCGTKGQPPMPPGKQQGPPRPFNKAVQMAKAQALRNRKPLPPEAEE